MEIREYVDTWPRPDLNYWPTEIQFMELKDCGDIKDRNPFSEKRLRVFLPNGCTVRGKMVGTCAVTVDEALLSALDYMKRN